MIHIYIKKRITFIDKWRIHLKCVYLFSKSTNQRSNSVVHESNTKHIARLCLQNVNKSMTYRENITIL